MVKMADFAMVKVTKCGEPVGGVIVYYVEQNQNSGNVTTEPDGCATLSLIGPTVVSIITFTVEGTKHEYPEKHLTKGVNEFHL